MGRCSCRGKHFSLKRAHRALGAQPSSHRGHFQGVQGPDLALTPAVRRRACCWPCRRARCWRRWRSCGSFGRRGARTSSTGTASALRNGARPQPGVCESAKLCGWGCKDTAELLTGMFPALCTSARPQPGAIGGWECVIWYGGGCRQQQRCNEAVFSPACALRPVRGLIILSSCRQWGCMHWVRVGYMKSHIMSGRCSICPWAVHVLKERLLKAAMIACSYYSQGAVLSQDGLHN